MADENFEPPEMGNLHDTENLDDMNNVQDNDNVNGKDNVHDTDHVHDADQVHDVNRMSIIQKQCMVLIMSMTDADHVHDTDDVQKMDNIHDPGTIPVVNSALEETHSSEEVKVTLTDTGAGKEKKWLGWPGENVFRMLVPIQKVGGIIGRKGEYIKKTCEETKACIKVLDGPPGTTERAHCKEKGPPADSPVAAAVAVADLRQTPQLRRTHQPAPAPAPAHPPASRLRRTHQPAPTSRSGAPTSRPQPPPPPFPSVPIAGESPTRRIRRDPAAPLRSPAPARPPPADPAAASRSPATAAQSPAADQPPGDF